MSRVFISGWGAVSPAGWGTAPLREALERGIPLAAQALARPGWTNPLRVREVPAPQPRPAFLAHPRLRRASAITHYAAGAALEALESAGALKPLPPRLGLVTCMLSGCVHYTQRFFDETLKDPATASPMLFPETVFNAPGSHLAALLGQSLTTHTLLGDPAAFLQGIALAAEWLADGRVDGCLVVGAEETNWVLADVLWHFDHSAELAGGAGALYLNRADAKTVNVELNVITEPLHFTSRCSRTDAARRVRQHLPAGSTNELLCDGRRGHPRADRAEAEAWRDWSGDRLSPKLVLGEGLMAASAWQCVAAADALARQRYSAVNVSVVGTNQQALGARFSRAA